MPDILSNIFYIWEKNFFQRQKAVVAPFFRVEALERLKTAFWELEEMDFSLCSLRLLTPQLLPHGILFSKSKANQT
jgi:hypothetical protein